MAEDKYISDLTGEQLDAAFAKMANIDQYVSQAAVSANGAQSSASAASQSAAQASDSAATAGQQATAAAGSASNAADSAEQAQASASAAAQSAQKAAESATGMSDFVQQAQASAQAAAQSASEAESSAGTAESAAQAAAGSEASVSANAEKAEQAATAAAASEAAAQNSAAQAAGSASDAAASAGLIQDNLDAIQAAPGAAQAAQQAASDAQAAQTAAEDAAERAEQIADFNPADFATAAQGEKADTAVQPDALDAYALKTEVPTTPGDIGAATAAQGAKADTAVQPADLSGYAKTSDIPTTPADIGAATAAQGAKADSAVRSVNGQEPDSQGDVQITIPPAGVTSVNGKTGAVTLSAADVGAAQELLTGDITDVTPAQVREALQAGRQVILTANSGDDILAAWVDTGANVQCMYGWDVATYAYRPRAISIDAYFGDPTGANTWSKEKLYGNVLPEVTSADNGKTAVVQNGQWSLGTAGGGGKFDFIANTGFTSWSKNDSYNSIALYTGNYDAVGIEFYPNYATDTDVFSPMQAFPIPESGQSRKYGVVCMGVNSSPMGEAQTRIIEIQNNGLAGVKITSVTGGYYYNWANRGADDRCAVPARIYGIKF